MKPKSWLIVIFAAVLLYTLIPQIIKNITLKRQLNQLEEDIRELSLKTATLENELKLLETDPLYVESVARRLFNKAKEGEVIYRFVDQIPAEAPAPAAAEKQTR